MTYIFRACGTLFDAYIGLPCSCLPMRVQSIGFSQSGRAALFQCGLLEGNSMQPSLG